MKNVKIILLAILMVIMYSCSDDFVEETEYSNYKSNNAISTRSIHDLCFMTWNVALGLGKSGDLSDEESALEICREIIASGADVITLQETWDFQATIILMECLAESGYSLSHTGFGTSVFGFPVESAGLLTIVKSDIAGDNEDLENSSTFIEFECEAGGLFGIGGSDYDALAGKGFYVTQLTLENGCEINVINTHMDSGEESQDICARICQINQMAEFMQDNNCGATLMGGDFNINAMDNETLVDEDCLEEFGIDPNSMTEFQILTSLFNGQATHLESQSPLGPTSLGGSGLIDYHIISNMEENFVNITSVTNVTMTCREFFTVTYKTFFGLITKVKEFDTLEEAQNFLDKIGKGFITGPLLECFEQIDYSDHTPVETCLEYDCDEAPASNSETFQTCTCEFAFFSFPIDCNNECPIGEKKIEEFSNCN